MNNSRSLDRLSSEDVKNFLSRYRDPTEARNLLIEIGIIDENGELAGPYKKSSEETEDAITQWRSEGRGVLFF